MKSTSVLFAFFVPLLSAIAQSPTPSVAPTPWPISAVKDITPAGVIVTGDYNAGPVAAFIKERPELADKVLAFIAGQIDKVDEISAAKTVARLSDAGLALPKATADKHAARIARFAKQKETALMKVKDTNPGRAKAKLDELLAAGIPISQTVRDSVTKAAAPLTATNPSATPADGL